METLIGKTLGEVFPELQKREALIRLNIMNRFGLMHEANSFLENGDVAIFERQNSIFNAVIYSLELNKHEEQYSDLLKKKIEFEKKYNALVYLIQLTHTTFGELYSFFYVSKSQNEWEFDKDDLMNCINKETSASVYVYNQTNPDSSEFGTILYKYSMGGIVRVS